MGCGSSSANENEHENDNRRGRLRFEEDKENEFDIVKFFRQVKQKIVEETKGKTAVEFKNI